MIVGEYISSNIDESAHISGIPKNGDILVLYKDGSYSSDFYGIGEYRLKQKLKGTEIQLLYHYEFGKAQFRANLSRSISGKPLIHLSDDGQYTKIH